MQITYDALIESRRQSLFAAGKSQKTIANAVSYLRGHFMSPLGRVGSDLVGSDFSDLAVFSHLLEKAGDAAGSNSRAVTASLKQWQRYYARMECDEVLPPDFSGALKKLLERKGFFRSGSFLLDEAAREIGLHTQILRRWVIEGRIPKKKSRKTVLKLERFFGLPQNTLTERAFHAKGFRTKESKAARGTSKRPTPHSLSVEDMPPHLIQEFKDLFDFKTSPTPPPGMERSGCWRVRSMDEWGGQKHPLASNSMGVSPGGSYSIFKIQGYLGFLVKERGVNKDSLSLAYIADAENIFKYINYLSRVRGKSTTNLTKNLTALAPLLRPGYGFVYQVAEFADRHPKRINRGDWANYCEEEYDKLYKMVSDLRAGNSIQVGRDPEDDIDAILRSPDPLSILMELEFRHRSTPPPPSQHYARFAWERNCLLLRMIISNPLRINHFSIMTWRPDNTGHLRQDKDGRWVICFEPRHFKNHHGAAKKKYFALVSPWASELIPYYLNEIRPNLHGARESDFVFLKSARCKNDRFQMVKLSDVIKDITLNHLADYCPNGFRAHGFRHIIATDLLKKGESVDMAAAALHDTPGMIRKRYGHLVAADGISVISERIAELQRNRVARGAA